mgnify:CR=1 FL=1
MFNTIILEYIQVNTEQGKPLKEWLEGENFVLWSQASNPATHRTRLLCVDLYSTTPRQSLYFARVADSKSYKPNIFSWKIFGKIQKKNVLRVVLKICYEHNPPMLLFE